MVGASNEVYCYWWWWSLSPLSSSYCKNWTLPKIGRWDWLSDVWILFEDNIASPIRPLHMETMNKQGACVLKVRCHICCNLFSYHNSSWTSTSHHILPHNIATPQDVVATTTLDSKCEANGKFFPMHKLHSQPLVKKETLGNSALMWCTFATPSYGTDMWP